MRTIDIKIHELCEEIDYWKQEAEFYKAKYEQESKERMAELNQRLKDSLNGVGTALLFAMAVKDNPDGSLSISKNDRKNLAEQLK